MDSLFDEIAQTLPERHREGFYRCVANLDGMGKDDVILVILQAMGFIGILLDETPRKLIPVIETAEKTLRLADARFNKIPEEIVRKIDIDRIAGNLTEAIKQRYLALGLDETMTLVKEEREKLQSHVVTLTKLLDALGNERTGQLQRLDGYLKGLEWRNTELHKSIDMLKASVFGGFTVCLILGVIVGFVVAKSL